MQLPSRWRVIIELKGEVEMMKIILLTKNIKKYVYLISLYLSLFSINNSYATIIYLPETSTGAWYDTDTQSISYNILSDMSRLMNIDFDGDHSTFASAYIAGHSSDLGFYGGAGAAAYYPGYGSYRDWAIFFAENAMGTTSAHDNHIAVWDTEWFYLYLNKTTAPSDFIVSFQKSDGVNPIPVTSGFWYTFHEEEEWNYFDPSQNPQNPSSVPEPTTMLLFGTGIASLAVSRLRRKKQ